MSSSLDNTLEAGRSRSFLRRFLCPAKIEPLLVVLKSNNIDFRVNCIHFTINMKPSTIAQTLRQITAAAADKGLTRRDLARLAGVRPETVSRIATRGTCDYATLERLANAAGLHLGVTRGEPSPGGSGHDDVLGKAGLIRTLAAAHGARSLELFGSAARGEDTPASDLDFMVELEPGRSLLDLIGLGEDLQAALGRRVDAVSKAGMKPRVLAQARRDAVRIV